MRKLPKIMLPCFCAVLGAVIVGVGVWKISATDNSGDNTNSSANSIQDSSMDNADSGIESSRDNADGGTNSRQTNSMDNTDSGTSSGQDISAGNTNSEIKVTAPDGSVYTIVNVPDKYLNMDNVKWEITNFDHSD